MNFNIKQKFFLVTSLFTICFLQAQLITREAPNSTGGNSLAFIDGSSNPGYNVSGANYVGKGILYPSMDLTAALNGAPFDSGNVGATNYNPNHYDGLVVYNTGTGVVTMGTSTKDVSPGFYYYNNSARTTWDGGTWMPLGGGGKFVDGTDPLNAVYTGGDVGIGIAAPTDDLHVDGDVRITGALKDASNSTGANGEILTSTATGTAWAPFPGISVGYKTWEFADDNNSEYLEADLGFTEFAFTKIPFNSSPVLVNTTGGAAGFTFNADGSVELEAGRTYRISVGIPLYYSQPTVLRIIESGTNNVLIQSGSYQIRASAGNVSLDAFVTPSTTADYEVQLYYGGGSTAYIATFPTSNFNVVLPRATMIVEVLE